MLVLGRLAGEKIVIDGVIEVTVVRVQADRVRLAITAPAGYPIFREEAPWAGNSSKKGTVVLSRKLDERVVIGDDISVMVVLLSSPDVRLGITAPKRIGIVRSELLAAA